MERKVLCVWHSILTSCRKCKTNKQTIQNKTKAELKSLEHFQSVHIVKKERACSENTKEPARGLLIGDSLGYLLRTRGYNTEEISEILGPFPGWSGQALGVK